MIGFQPFLVIFFAWPLSFSVHFYSMHCCFGRYFLFSFLVYFSTLSIFHYEFHVTLFNHYAHLGTYVHIFIRTNRARITTTAVLYPGVWTENRNSFFFGRFFSVFPHRKPTLYCRFFGCSKKPKPKKRLGLFSVGFFPLSPTLITPTYLCWNAMPPCMDSPLAPADSNTQQSSTAPV